MSKGIAASDIDLANAIENVLLKQISLFEQDQEIEKLASNYASIIIQNRINNEPVSPSDLYS